MYYDLLVQVDLADESRFAMALSNITNYLAALPNEQYQVVLLANGGAARFLTAADNAHRDTIHTLAEQGVAFRVCANAMKKGNITEADLLPEATVVPAGVVELVRLQREGYAYVKP